ncbi:unnamed protein product [Paramecium pentaurelia]|uniref:Uncharacterized protein n=1 Tax=Paramecium pentaurelia TaxID=43138 RepID=A0A8S1VRW3_9CILI|nr:unnamed protein product [Paramecium pentaurelia]
MIDSLWTKNQIKSVPVIQDFSKRGLSKSYQKWLLHIIVQSSQFKIKFCHKSFHITRAQFQNTNLQYNQNIRGNICQLLSHFILKSIMSNKQVFRL